MHFSVYRFNYLGYITTAISYHDAKKSKDVQHDFKPREEKLN